MMETKNREKRQKGGYRMDTPVDYQPIADAWTAEQRRNVLTLRKSEEREEEKRGRG